MLDRTSRLRPADAATLRGWISISYRSGRYRKYCRLYVAEEANGRDLGFQINSYDRPLPSPPHPGISCAAFPPFRSVLRENSGAYACCRQVLSPLENDIDSAPSSMSDLNFENSGAYKATAPRNQPAETSLNPFLSFLPSSPPRRFRLSKHFKML